MEDSYTVHRRRKAAARRRDKTPEASRAAAAAKEQHDIEDEEEDKEKVEARARIERMVEDTERLEEFVNDGRRKSPGPPTPRATSDEESQVLIIPEEDKEQIQTTPKPVDDIDKKDSVEMQKPVEPTEENCRVKTTSTNENRMDFKRVKVKGETSRRHGRRLEEERWSSSDSSLVEDNKSDVEETIRKRDKKPRKVRKERKEESQQVSGSTLTLSSKQIIPLSDDSLIEDLKKAQREYERREIGILDVQLDDHVHPKIEAALRKRKKSKIEKEEVKQPDDEEEVKVFGSWSKVWTWLWRSEPKEKEKVIEATKIIEEKIISKPEKPIKKSNSKFLEFLRHLSDVKAELKAFADRNPHEAYLLRKSRNKCIAQLILIIIYCGLGAFIFRFMEGAFETFYKCGVKRVKRDFLDSLWNYSHNLREDDWKSMARRKLMEFEEQLHAAHEAGVHSYSGQKSWTFLNAVVYCLTVITTIGYGHISPSTTTGRAVTIIYAIFGIPMFLIILADFGKLFTRGIKFLWAFVRRVYYTGSCRRVRRTGPVQEVMKGVQLVYDLATFRRPSQMNPEELEEMRKQQTQTVLNLDGNAPATQPDTPATPAMSNFAIDDEFNLPISVAITILVIYIFVGATAYNLWERWGFFESFYFVFISMSTIGFGDYVPKHPMYMMCSIVYLVFGLALTSMCINVVQTMLSDSFKHATQKIGATIGFEVAEDDGSIQPAAPPPVEVAEVHATIKEEDDNDDELTKKKVAPKARKDDAEL